MMDHVRNIGIDIRSPYRPVAIYYEAADCVEYVRVDEPSVHRRVDKILTLILSMDTRNPIGFKLKGFKHYFLTKIKERYNLKDRDFIMLIDVIEDALKITGDDIFKEEMRTRAYEDALEIARNDKVSLREDALVA